MSHKTFLITSYYTDKDQRRDNELLACLALNLTNQFIHEIILMVGNKWKLIVTYNCSLFDLSSRAKELNDTDRPTYKEAFESVIDENLDSNNIFIIANSDIVIPESTVVRIRENIKDNEVYCLSRYDITDKITLLNRRDSQDCWIMNGNTYKTLRENKDKFDIQFGKPGCDNRIALLLEETGMKVSNPSFDIVTHHYHNTNVRNYTRKEEDVVKGPYRLLQPTGLID
jgi:hypothetical protein